MTVQGAQMLRRQNRDYEGERKGLLPEPVYVCMSVQGAQMVRRQNRDPDGVRKGLLPEPVYVCVCACCVP